MDDRIKNGIATAVQTAGNFLRKKWEDANAKALDIQRAQADAQRIEGMLEVYPVVGEMLGKAINNINADIKPVSDLSQIAVGTPIGKTHRGLFVWKFRAHMRRGACDPAAYVNRVLQTELDEITAIYGFPRLCVKIQFAADDIVWIAVAYYSDTIANDSGVKI